VWRWPTTIEQLLTHPAGFGLSTATNCQRAWCRILDGEPLGDLWRDARVQKMLRGGEQQEEAPYEVVGVAGIRTAKSMIGACFCAIRARYADMSRIRPGENPPILPVTSVRTLNAKAIVGHCGGLLSRSNFSGWLAKKPTSEEVWIKHYETGAPIKVMVIAGSSGASNLTSYWHASVVVDEAFKLPSEKDDAKVNLEDVRRNITGRVLPHGQVLYEGSPWHAQGPAYELIEEYEGKPSRECVVLRTNGPDMNPILWTPEEMERMAASKDQAIRDALTMGGLGIFLSDIQGLVSDSTIQACTRQPPNPLELRPERYQRYWAVIDPATRRNAWPLIICHRRGKKLVVDVAREWIPSSSKRLNTHEVLDEIHQLVSLYGITTVYTDQWSSDALADTADSQGFELVDASRKPEQKQREFKRLIEGLESHDRYELPPLRTLARDLKSIGRKTSPVSGTRYHLIETADGRHADFAAALCLADSIAYQDELPLEDRFPSGWMGRPSEVRRIPRVPDIGVLRPVRDEDYRLLVGGSR
jgi:hypothetical protein